MKRKNQSTISINYMALPRSHMKVGALIGGNARMVRAKDMEHMSGLAERDILGSTCRVSNTGMEYTHGQGEKYIMDNGNKIKEKVMHITVGQMVMSVMVSGRKIICTDREYSKKMA